MRTERLRASKRPAGVTIELAVLLPFLVLLIFVGVDFARIYYCELTLINAARTGAVYASAHPDNVNKTDTIKAVALGDAKNLVPAPEVTSASSTDENNIQYVTVTVKWNFYTVMGYPGVPQPFALERSVKMRVAPIEPDDVAITSGGG